MATTTIAPAYKADGVNVEEGDSFSEFASHICRASYENSSLIKVRDWSQGRFRGPRTFRFRQEISADCELSGDPDGNGTRTIMDAVSDQAEVACTSLIAMTGMDGVRYGGRNAVLFNQLDVSSLGENGDAVNLYFRRLIASLGARAKEQGIVALKGETAEMGVCISSEDPSIRVKYVWGGLMLSVFHPSVGITGEDLKEGQIAVALSERGLRANGGSSARKAFAMWYGPQWYNVPAAREDIAAASAPCVLYENFLQDMNGWNTLDKGVPVPKIRVKAIAHITGGGIPSKFFGDLLKPHGFSCDLTELPEPPPIMRKFAKWRGISGKEPYEIWHGGPGVIVVLDSADVINFCALAGGAGHEATPAGIITKSDKPTLKITSRFDGSVLTWD